MEALSIISYRSLLVPLVLVLCCSTGNPARATPPIDEPLRVGNLGQAETLLADHLRSEPADDLARFQLGTVRFLKAIEQLAQDASRYGASTRTLQLPFLRLGALGGNNPNPEPVGYEDVRQMIERFYEGVANAEQTLEPIRDTDLYWELDLSTVGIDFDRDGALGRLETLEATFRLVTSRRPNPGEGPVVVGFDSADACWLRGYCHVLLALADAVLAYDHEELFEHTAHLFFADPRTEFARERDLRNAPAPRRRGFFGDMETLSDLIAAVHLMSFKTREPRRLADAREHLLEMVRLSRKNWELIQQETDDRHEWIPGPNQTSVIPRLAAGGEQIEAWGRFLDEAEAILNGEILLPFWRRGFEDRGLNLRRVFDDPRDFDLILWLQGTAALPYLERGETTDPALWREFQRIFRGQLLGFALWVN